MLPDYKVFPLYLLPLYKVPEVDPHILGQSLCSRRWPDQVHARLHHLQPEVLLELLCHDNSCQRWPTDEQED